MWMREMIPAPFIYVPSDDASDRVVYQTGVKDWLRAGTAKKDYLRIDQGVDFLTENFFHRYTTYIYAVNDSIINTTIQGSSETSHAVFVDDEEVKGIQHSYPIVLRAGWNKIEVYAYARKINEELILDIYVPNTNYEVFAYKDLLEQVSVYDLLNNTNNRMHNRFAIDKKNNVLVNYNPLNMELAMRQNTLTQSISRIENGMEYTLEYAYAVTDKEVHHVRMMAVLSKENELVNTIPRLASYQLKIV